MNDVTFCRYNAAEARRLRDTVEEIYVRSYVEAIARADPFDRIDPFMDRFDFYASRPDFDLVVAYQGSETIGQTWGWPLTENNRRWEGLLSEPELGSLVKMAAAHPPFLRSWRLRSGQGKVLRDSSRGTGKYQGLPCVLALGLAQSYTIASQLG